jgi:hypothetical protein
MVFNDLIFLEITLLSLVFFYLTTINLTTLLYVSGIYLMLIGILCLINDCDIYIGFLWVIDLGVGLIFFIFILHFTSFLFQKPHFSITTRYFFMFYIFLLFYIFFFYFYSFSANNLMSYSFTKTWYFKIQHLDYYFIFNSREVTELNLLKDSYFLLNSFEFFVINFSILFGLLGSIFLCFLIQRIFNFINYNFIKNSNTLESIDSSFFIRLQDYLSQTNTPQNTRVWSRVKK